MTPAERASQWTQIRTRSSHLHLTHVSLHLVARILQDAIVRAGHHRPGQTPR
ncbi:MAG TPA: hypothetical protein VIJ09_00800 [Acidimicrobiales bacterium]